ncbi:MAG: HlyD family efflux transporter periplasmic adaptor subunit [Candidatus Paceibacterota bacterium]
MKNYLNKIKNYITLHKFISTIILIVILLIGYWGYGKATNTTGETQYITTTVQKGTIVSSVTASGQVESSNQIDLTAKVSGTITYVGVKAGDKVTKGKTLFSIDNSDAKKTIRDAEINLENANLALQKLKIQNSDTNLSADLVRAYDDGFNAVSNTFLDLSSVIPGVEDILNESNLSDNAARDSGIIAVDYKRKAEKLYYEAQNDFQENAVFFRTLDHSSSETDIEKIIDDTYKVTITLSDALNSTKNYVDYLAQNTGRTSDFSSFQDTLSDYISKINADTSSLFSAKTNITSYKDTSISNNLDIQTSELSLKQKENALQDAKDDLLNYYLFAPFDGIIASITAKVGDTASGTLGSIITNQKIATLSMNEVDVAKIKLGEKAIITFDAVENLSMTGSVVEIDTIGTVSSGVVTYAVKVAFDTENDQVKPGMSVSASIITDSKTDILIVPSSAIKTKGTTKYVQMFTTPLAAPATGSRGTPSSVEPNQVTVEIGISDDTNTEIISGLKEGDQIVSSTITSSTTNTTSKTSTNSLLGGGAPRM